jgi:hypothetical protein
MKTVYGSGGAENRALCLVIGGQKINQIDSKMVESLWKGTDFFKKTPLKINLLCNI